MIWGNVAYWKFIVVSTVYDGYTVELLATVVSGSTGNVLSSSGSNTSADRRTAVGLDY